MRYGQVDQIVEESICSLLGKHVLYEIANLSERQETEVKTRVLRASDGLSQ